MLPVLTSLVRSLVTAGLRVLPRAAASKIGRTVAKTLSRVTAKGAARAVQATGDAASGAAQAAAQQAPGAAQGAVQALENTELTNAKAIRDALNGAGAGGAPAAPPVSVTPVAPPAGAGEAIPPPRVTPQSPGPVAPEAAPPPTRPGTPPPGAPEPAAPAPAQPNGEAPANPAGEPAASKGWLDGLLDKWNDWRARAARTLADQIPTSQKVEGLTEQQRYDRLQDNGHLLPTAQVAKQNATPVPNMRQMVEASEAAEEKARQERLAEAAQQNSLFGVGKDIAAKSIKGTFNGATGFYTLEKALETFAKLIAESNRGLAKFNGRIAASFAEKDMAQLESDWQTAQGTQGSASELNHQIAELIRETQPMRQDMATMLNVIGVWAARSARTMTTIIKYLPLVSPATQALKTMEEMLTKGKKADLFAARDKMLSDIRDGKFARPINPPPHKRKP